MRLNHVALSVRDRSRSEAFYTEHFGFIDRIHDDQHLLILRSSDGSLLALSDGLLPSDAEAFHFGFQVAGGDEVRAARSQFQTAGVPETEWQDDGRFVRVQVSDPDGYRIDIYAY